MALVAVPDELAVGEGDDAGAVGVREQQVVVLGKEARRGRDAGVRPGGVGEVEEFDAVLVLEGAELIAQPLEDRGEPGESAPGLRVLHGGGSEGGEVARHGGFRRAARRRVAPSAPNHFWAVVSVTRPPRPHSPRGVTCTSGSRQRAATESASGSAPGHRSASAAFNSLSGRGRSSTSSLLYAASRSRSTPTRPARKVRNSRSIMGWTNGRRARQSSAVWVWMVERRVTIRPTSREAISPDSSAGSNPSSLAASWTYGGFTFCAWSPTRCVTASLADMAARRSRSCRARVARLSARVVSRGCESGSVVFGAMHHTLRRLADGFCPRSPEASAEPLRRSR